MTREEAREALQEQIDKYGQEYDDKGIEALEMAIEALKPKPMQKFDNVKQHIDRLAGDYKCWDERLSHEEALELSRMLEQQPCEDAISREVVEKITWEEPSYIDPINALTEVREKIRALPSIVPQPKIGKWEIVACDLYMCSKCYSKYTYKSNFCSNCGAKMEVRNRYGRQ